MTGWSGGAANRTWHRGYQPDGTEARELLGVLAEFRREHGWQAGMERNPFTGAYEWPENDTPKP